VDSLRLKHYPAMVTHTIKSAPSWVFVSPPARLFAMLVHRSGAHVFSGAAGQSTLNTFVACTHQNRDAKLRASFLSLLAEVFSAPDAAPHCNRIAAVLLTQCALPNCTWRAGAAAAAARSAAVRLLGMIIKVHRVQSTYVSLLPKGIIAVLLSGLEEEDAATRLLACETLATLFTLVKEQLGYEDTRRSIPEILKRLDDSRDHVRLSALDTVTAFVHVVQAQSCSTYFEYIVEAVLNYLEDSDHTMKEKARVTLMSYAELDPDKFQKVVTKYMQRGTSSAMEQCSELLAHARQAESSQKQ